MDMVTDMATVMVMDTATDMVIMDTMVSVGKKNECKTYFYPNNKKIKGKKHSSFLGRA